MASDDGSGSSKREAIRPATGFRHRNRQRRRSGDGHRGPVHQQRHRQRCHQHHDPAGHVHVRISHSKKIQANPHDASENEGAQRRLRQNRQHYFFPPFAFGLRNLVGQHAQLPLVEHRGIHHADQDLFDGAVAEPVDDALDGLGRDPPARLGRLVDIGSAVHGVGGVALVFEPSQHGPDGRFLERTGKPFAHGLGRHRTVGPNQLHDLALEVTQFGQAVVHVATLRSWASCNATERRI